MRTIAWIVKTALFTAVCASVISCGFQLRGTYAIPKYLKLLTLSPEEPHAPFQRALIQVLASNGIMMNSHSEQSPSTLTLLSQELNERTTAYGSDGQANRATLQLKVNYQLTLSSGTCLSSNYVQVEREITVAPNAILATETQRKRILSDLYRDAASQLLRQLIQHPHH